MSNRWSGARPSFDTPQAHGIVDFRRLPSESYPAPSADQAVELLLPSEETQPYADMPRVTQSRPSRRVRAHLGARCLRLNGGFDLLSSRLPRRCTSYGHDSSSAERASQVSGVFLRLLEQRCQRFRHVRKAEFIRLFDPLAVADQLSFLEREIALERLPRFSAWGRFADPCRRDALEEVDLAGQSQRVVELLTNVDGELVERRLVLGTLDGRDVLDVLDHGLVFEFQVLIQRGHEAFTIHG
jgi:hypothetical protein